MNPSYRDPRYAASLRLEHLRERFQQRGEGIPREILDIQARRAARSWAGAVAIAGFFATALVTGLRALDTQPWDVQIGLHPTVVWIGAVVLSLGVYLVARPIARRSFERRVRGSFDDDGDELARLARYEGDALRGAAVKLVDAGEHRSLWLPIAGVGLLAPLSLHLVIWLMVGDDAGSARWLDKFDAWIGLSLVLVGLAHLAIVVLGYAFASRVRLSSSSELARKSPLGGWTALGITLVVSLVPGVILIAIPPIIVLLTGLPVLPALFGKMYRSALAERHALSAA